jgi:hypothetical protein
MRMSGSTPRCSMCSPGQSMKLRPDEALLEGSWVLDNGVMHSDKVTERIRWLIDHHLHEVAEHPRWGRGRSSIAILKTDGIGREPFLGARCREWPSQTAAHHAGCGRAQVRFGKELTAAARHQSPISVTVHPKRRTTVRCILHGLVRKVIIVCYACWCSVSTLTTLDI